MTRLLLQIISDKIQEKEVIYSLTLLVCRRAFGIQTACDCIDIPDIAAQTLNVHARTGTLSLEGIQVR